MGQPHLSSMPTTTDPADWIPALINDRWDQAKESLRASGVNVSLDRAAAFAAADKRSGGVASSTVKLKVYQETEEATGSVAAGDYDLDSRVNWAIRITSLQKGGEARKRCHEASLIVQRVLQLYRRRPHPDWHTINDVRIRHGDDYFDKQVRTLTFQLERFGEVLPDPIEQVTT